MVTWEQLQFKIRQWVRLEIQDHEFYTWLEVAKFERDIDRVLADMFITQKVQ